MKANKKLLSAMIAIIFLFTCCGDDQKCENAVKVVIKQEGTNVLKAEALGDPPFHFAWANSVSMMSGLSEITANISGLYKVTATDINGCTGEAFYTFVCNTCNECGEDTVVEDSEGNVYKILSIGNRCWMIENLNVSSGIPQVTDNSIWASLTTPAWCYYDNSSINGALYGKLYNFYAAYDEFLCPVGWHLPTEGEWQVLIDILGGASVAGGKLKDTILWTSPNTGATNSSGFSALPAGIRNLSGDFVSAGDYTVFWTSTPVTLDLEQAKAFELSYNNTDFNSATSNSPRGYSCRCVKDL